MRISTVHMTCVSIHMRKEPRYHPDHLSMIAREAAAETERRPVITYSAVFAADDGGIMPEIQISSELASELRVGDRCAISITLE